MINLYYILANFGKIATLLGDFLSYSDLARLASSSKLLNPLIFELLLEKIKSKYQAFLSNSLKKFKPKNPNEKFKIIKTPSSTILKMSVFDLPNEFLSKKFWKILSISGKDLQMLLKDEKFIKEQNNMFFRNANDQLMFMNRTLIDDGLNFEGKLEKSDAFEETKYEKLYSDNDLTANSYDFSSMQSMLQRQKKIINNMNLQNQKNENLSKQSFELQLQKLQNIKKICLILCHGGNFSIGIFDKTGKCLLHRSDHKYVTRKKAGQRQMAKDKHSGSSIKSIGSQIRRENEKVHQMNVDNILEENFKEIQDCEIVLFQAPGMNKLLLIDENKPLALIKHKLRSMCLTAKKANYTEVERLFKAISKIYLIIE